MAGSRYETNSLSVFSLAGNRSATSIAKKGLSNSENIPESLQTKIDSEAARERVDLGISQNIRPALGKYTVSVGTGIFGDPAKRPEIVAAGAAIEKHLAHILFTVRTKSYAPVVAAPEKEQETAPQNTFVPPQLRK